MNKVFWVILKTGMRCGKIYILSIGLLGCMHGNLFGQYCDSSIKAAVSAICRNDTLAALQYLDNYGRQCKNDEMNAFVLLMRSEIYRAMGKMDKSVDALEAALKASPTFMQVSFEEDTCLFVFQMTEKNYVISKHLLLMKSIDAYCELKDFQKSIDLLGKIDRNEILGYSGCVNGQISIESKIAYRYATCYLGLKDTLNAINKLLDYAIFEEGDISLKLARKLKELLLTQYSQKQISEEIERSIANAKEITIAASNGFTSKNTEYWLFGRKIPYIYMSLETFKYYVEHSKNLIFLKGN